MTTTTSAGDQASHGHHGHQGQLASHGAEGSSGRPAAGTILEAADALRQAPDQRRTFSRAQVAHLMALAYDSGRASACGHEELVSLAELLCMQADHPVVRVTYEQAVERRIAEMVASGERARQRPPMVMPPDKSPPCTLAGCPCRPEVVEPWPEVTVPGANTEGSGRLQAARPRREDATRGSRARNETT